MICPHCNAPQAAQTRFCRSCGQSMSALAAKVSCPSCHFPNALEARFCKQCGTGLAAVAESSVTPVAIAEDKVTPITIAKSNAAPVVIAEDSITSVAIAEGGVANTVVPEPAHSSVEVARPAPVRLLLIVGIVFVVLLVSAAAVWFFAFREEPESQITPVVPLSVQEVSPSEKDEMPIETELLADEVVKPTEVLPETDAPVQKTAPKTEGKKSVPWEEENTVVKTEGERNETPSDNDAIPEKKTCSGLVGFNILICRAEGPKRFWRCAPDGVNWNNDIPGCRRGSGS